MRNLVFCLLSVACLGSLQAHHPDRDAKPVRPPFNLIGPLGNRLPMSYRRRYNRPTNLGGKIAYYIAPTSQEAMQWHKSAHRGYYQNDAPRMVDYYFYPKPWEVIRIGARPSLDPNPDEDQMELPPMELPPMLDDLEVVEPLESDGEGASDIKDLRP